MILVTGASGFLGQHLVKFLSSKNLKIRALYYNNPPSNVLSGLPNVEWVKCDLLDIFAVEEVMKSITEIYHCAAIVSFDSKYHNQMLHFNAESTANVVNEALLQGIRKLVHVSSIAAIGRTGNTKKVVTEEEEWGESQHGSAYGLSKYLAETEVWRGIGEGLKAVIVNPGIILGDGEMTEGLRSIVTLALKEFPFYTSGLNAWVDVADVVTIMYKLMTSEINAERFILSTDNVSYKDIFTMLAKALNKKPPRFKANSFTTGLAWRFSKIGSLFTGKRPTITKETANTANEYWYFDNKKILKALPDFNYSPLKNTIEKMAKFYTSGR